MHVHLNVKLPAAIRSSKLSASENAWQTAHINLQVPFTQLNHTRKDASLYLFIYACMYYSVCML